MSKKVIAALVFCTVAVPMSAALAVTPIPPAAGVHTWAEIKDDCANWQRYHQLAPVVNITCRDWSTHWEQQLQSTATPSLGHFEARFGSSKVGGGYESADVTIPGASPCPVYIEVRRDRTITPNVTCDDVLQYDSAQALCQVFLDRVPEQEIVKTALRQINTCTGVAINEADLPPAQNGH